MFPTHEGPISLTYVSQSARELMYGTHSKSISVLCLGLTGCEESRLAAGFPAFSVVSVPLEWGNH